MAGLSNGHVIHPDFEARNAPAAEDVMTATCSVTRQTTNPGPQGFDATTGRSVYPAATSVYTGPCRVQTQAAGLGGGRAPEVGEKTTTLHSYEVGMPLAAPLLRVNDVVEVTAAKDAAFIGRKLRVVGVQGGSIVWQRTYSCEEWTPTAR